MTWSITLSSFQRDVELQAGTEALPQVVPCQEQTCHQSPSQVSPRLDLQTCHDIFTFRKMLGLHNKLADEDDAVCWL